MQTGDICQSDKITQSRIFPDHARFSRYWQGLRYSFSQRSLSVRLPILQNNVAAEVNHCGAHILLSTERSAGRPRFAYFPFSGGPRQCIGNEFSLLESTVIPAMVTQRYDVNRRLGTKSSWILLSHCVRVIVYWSRLAGRKPHRDSGFALLIPTCSSW